MKVVEAVPESILGAVELHLQGIVGDGGFHNIIIESALEEEQCCGGIVWHVVASRCLEALCDVGFSASEDIIDAHFVVVESDL